MSGSPRNHELIKEEEIEVDRPRVQPISVERLPQVRPWENTDLHQREYWRQAKAMERLSVKNQYRYYETGDQGQQVERFNMAQLRFDDPYTSIGLKLNECVDAIIASGDDPNRRPVVDQWARERLDAINTILDDCESGINNRIQHIAKRQEALIGLEDNYWHQTFYYIDGAIETQTRRGDRHIDKQLFLDHLIENMQNDNRSMHEHLRQYGTDDQMYYGLPSPDGNAPPYGLTVGEYGRIYQDGNVGKQLEKLDRGAYQMVQHARLRSLDLDILRYERHKMVEMSWNRMTAQDAYTYNMNYSVALRNFANQELDRIDALRGEMSIIGAHVDWPVQPG